MKMLTCIDCLVFVYRPIFSQGSEIVIVENAGYDALGYHSLTLVVDKASGKDVQAFNV